MARTHDRLPSTQRPETEVLNRHLQALSGALDWAAAAAVAAPWVRAVRENPPPFGPWKACSRNTPFPAPKAWR